ncbi:MAG: transposase, partial [Sphaerospermopsis kisseleviana]
INELLPSMPHVAVSRPIHLIDATAVRTMDQSIWRIHAVYDATQSQLKQVLLTDERQGETLKHFTPEAGVLYIGDRAYQGKDGVRQFLDAGADLLIRVKIRPYLAHKNPDHLVELPTKGGRVIIAPIPKEKWEAIDSRQQRQQQRKQRKRSKQPAESHYYLTLFCSDATLSGEEAVAFYRWRWQIELMFKQLKSIQGLDETQLKSPALLRVYFLCQILVRLLSERLFTKGLFPPEVGISYVCLASISD